MMSNFRCQCKNSCSNVRVSNSLFERGDPCPGTKKYLEVRYECLEPLQEGDGCHLPQPPAHANIEGYDSNIIDECVEPHGSTIR